MYKHLSDVYGNGVKSEKHLGNNISGLWKQCVPSTVLYVCRITAKTLCKSHVDAYSQGTVLTNVSVIMQLSSIGITTHDTCLHANPSVTSHHTVDSSSGTPRYTFSMLASPTLACLQSNRCLTIFITLCCLDR